MNRPRFVRVTPNIDLLDFRTSVDGCLQLVTAASQFDSAGASPFDLRDDTAYRAWRDVKLAAAPAGAGAGALWVDIDDPFRLSSAEKHRIAEALERANLALYRLSRPCDEKRMVRALGAQLGLHRLDGNLCADEDNVSAIRVVEKRAVGEYIPYTDKRLNWHTDGYYNATDAQVRGIILHCAMPAAEGGANAFLDHEIAYILLRDENPDYIAALMAPDAMTIPPNVQNGETLRPAQSGPVFSVDDGGHLHMRYSARGRNIEWSPDPVARAAAARLLDLFETGSPFIVHHRLAAGEGVISNNALHCRDAFRDDPASGRVRLLYRARYYDRIRIGTD